MARYDISFTFRVLPITLRTSWRKTVASRHSWPAGKRWLFGATEPASLPTGLSHPRIAPEELVTGDSAEMGSKAYSRGRCMRAVWAARPRGLIHKGCIRITTCYNKTRIAEILAQKGHSSPSEFRAASARGYDR